MRILLINPPADNEITTQVSRFATGESSLQPPLGLAYIAAVLLEAGYSDVSIIDSQAEKLSYSELETRIVRDKPDIVGMTAMTFTMVDVVHTARLVRMAAPAAVIVVGGPHVDIYPKETVQIPEIDYAIRKEGEYPFLQLVRYLDGGKQGSISEVQNLVWIKGEGEVVMNPMLEKLNDYSLMPFPARQLLPVQSYFSIMTENNPITTMITAKGCPYQCYFCYRNIERVQQRTPASIVDEMEAIRESGIREVFFVDDTFYVNTKIAMATCDEILRRGLAFPWAARARVNNLNDEVLEKFKKAGCRRLHIGVEAGNDRILKNLNKMITVEMVRKAFVLCRKHKIDTLAYFIIGNPGETERDVEDTIRLAKEIKPDFVQFSRMTPFPATRLYEMGIERGIIPYDYWRKFAENPAQGVKPYFWTEHFTQEQLADLADYATRKFYLRLSYALKTAMRLRSFTELRRKARTAIKLLRARLPRLPYKLKMT